MNKAALEKALSETIGKPSGKKEKKSKSSPLREFAKRVNIPDDEFDDFKMMFTEAVRDVSSN